MPWNGSAPNQTAGRTDGTRTGATTWQQADAASVDIISTDHDTHDQDVNDMVNACFKKDGGNTATASLPMGGFKLTNLAAGAARTDSTRVADVQDSKATYYPTVGGTADAITLAGASAAITAYAAGQTFSFLATGTNTTAVTLNVDAVGVKNVKDSGGAALQAGAIVSGSIVTVRYDGTQFQADTGTAAVAITVGTIMAWPTSTVPTGWLECYGQSLLRTDYAALFAVLSTTYGAADGDHFTLPDMRGRAVFGEDDMGGTSANRLTGITNGVNGDTLGNTGGLESTTIAQANLPAVNLSSASLTASSVVTNGDQVVRGANSASPGGGTNTGSTTSTITVATSIGGNVPLGGSGTVINNVPPAIVFKWIILALPSSTLPAYGGGVNVASGYTASPRLVHTGAQKAMISTDGTNLSVVVTELYVAEVFIPCNMTLTGVSVMWGDATNGNAKVMLFNSAGTRVALSASTSVAAATVDAYTRTAFSATYAAVGPATYYVGVICDDNTNRLNTHAFGDFGAGKITGLVYATEAGYATISAPSTFTADLGPIASLY